MAIKQVKYNEETIYIDDEVSEEEKGYVIKNIESNKELETTKVLSQIDKDYDLEDTFIIEMEQGSQDE